MSSEPEREDSQETTLGEYAGFVTRLLGLIVDFLILSGILALVTLVTNMVLELFPIKEALGLGELSSTLVAVLAALLSVGIALFYCTGSWALVGQSPGQHLVGVRVVTVNGDRIGFWAAVVRFLGYFVSAILFLGFLWVLVDDKRQGFHDKMAGTYVIYSWPEGPLRGTAVRDRAREIKDRREQRLKQRKQGQ